MNMIPSVMANEPGIAQTVNPGQPGIVVYGSCASTERSASLFERRH